MKRHEPDGALSGTSETASVFVWPSGAELVGSPEISYAALLSARGMGLPMDCGGRGTCGRCRVRFLSAAPEPGDGEVRALTSDELLCGWRLACLHLLEDGAWVEVSTDAGGLQTKGEGDVELPPFQLDTGIRAVRASLPARRSSSSRSREATLREALDSPLLFSLDALQELSCIPLDEPAEVEAILRGRTVMAIRPPRGRSTLCGAAIDIGTTTLAVYVYDLETGDQMSASVGRNPQLRFGADVISRIGLAKSGGAGAVEMMRHSVVDGIGTLIGHACRLAGIAPTDLWRFVAVGNCTMLHLFLGLSPVAMGYAPYVPTLNGAFDVAAGEIGLPGRRDARVHLLPSVSAYVGADLVAGILATRLGHDAAPELLIDVGTNAEIALAADGRYLVCSTAAGPALEGATISQGMYAVAGAIDAVRADGDMLVSRTIEGAPPVGICGAGLLSAIGALLRVGLVDPAGHLRRPGTPMDALLSGQGRASKVRLSDSPHPVALTQGDVREFQVAKAAIRAGIDVVLGRAGVRAEDLSRVFIAGALGAELDVDAAWRTGLLPAMAPGQVIATGNAAGRGAALALLALAEQEKAMDVVARTESIELSRSDLFRKLYLTRMSLSPSLPADSGSSR